MKRGKLVINNFAELGFPEVLTLGRNNNLSAIRGWPKHTHEGFEIIYLARGRQIMGASGKGYVVSGGDFFVVQPNEIHSTGIHPVGRVLLYWIQIQRPRRKDLLGLPRAEADALICSLRNLPGPHFPADPEVKDLLECIIAATQSQDPLAATRLRQALTQILLTVVDCGQAAPERNLTPDIKATVAHVRQCLKEPIMVEELAELAGLSVSRYRAKFRKQLGMSPSEFILRRKVDAAIDRILEGQRSITEIAYDLGFSSSQYFATVFKRFTMQTPSRFHTDCRREERER